MDKQLIERIALEVAKGIQVPLMPEGTVYFVTADLAIEICTRFLARIDAPQPPAPCSETETEVRYLKAVMQMDAAEIAELKAKVKGIEKDRDAAWSINPAVSEQMLLAKVAKQSAEFTAFHNRAHNHSEKQSALIKELTETRDALWETQRSLCNQVYERDMLIERCRDALSMPCDRWNKQQSLIVNDVLEAIAAHKKGIAE